MKLIRISRLALKDTKTEDCFKPGLTEMPLYKYELKTEINNECLMN